MAISFTRFLLITIAILIFLIIILSTVIEIKYPEAFIPALYAIGFMAGLTLLAFNIANKNLMASPGKFVGAVMGAIGLKMAASLVVILLVVLWDKALAIPFTVSYFVGYIAFTSFEIYALLHNLRAVSKNPTATDAGK